MIHLNNEPATTSGYFPSAQAHIEERSIPEPNSGCWLWLGAVTDNGYGRASDARFPTEHRAHRISYLAFNGPIPEGLFVCHSCDMPSCVNPSHLWVGTASDNGLDRDAKGRWRAGGTPRKQRCIHGHVYKTTSRGRQVCGECQRVAVANYRRRRALAKAGAAR